MPREACSGVRFDGVCAAGALRNETAVADGCSQSQTISDGADQLQTPFVRVPCTPPVSAADGTSRRLLGLAGWVHVDSAANLRSIGSRR